MNIPCEEAIIAVTRCKKSDRRDKRNKRRREKLKDQLSQTGL